MNFRHRFVNPDQMTNRMRTRQWYELRNEADGAARLNIYGVVGLWENSAQELVRELTDLDVTALDVHIDSGGGLAFDGIAIYNALLDHKAEVTVTVDGIAASAASIIAMAGDTVKMNRSSQLMIHNAGGFCEGQAEDMRSMAAALDRLDAQIAKVYARRAGGEPEAWRKLMAAETWYDADEAVEAGLADSTADDEPEARIPLAAFTSAFNYRYPGRDQAPAPLPLDQIETAGAIPPADAGGTVITDPGASILRLIQEASGG